VSLRAIIARLSTRLIPTLNMRLFFWLFFVLLSGCSSGLNPIDRIKPHKIDIPQGNVLSQDVLDKLKPGMTPSQVRFIMGTPLLVDPFRNNRWDYVYRLERQGRLVEYRRVTVLFENDRLKALQGDVAAAPGPAQQEGVSK
jgi:outer membrane protein assembly factor BamE